MTRKEKEYFDKIMKEACEMYIDQEYPQMLKELENAENHEFSNRFYKNMDKIIKKETDKTKRKRQNFMKVAIVTIVFIAGGLYEGTKDTEAFKLKFIQEIIKKYSDHRDRTYLTENFPYDLSVVPKDWEFIYVSKKIPLGLNLDKMYEKDNKVITYFSASDKYIEFTQTNNLNYKFIVNDYKSLEVININKVNGTYYEMEEDNIFVWNKGAYAFQIKSNFEKDEIIDIAANLKMIDAKN